MNLLGPIGSRNDSMCQNTIARSHGVMAELSVVLVIGEDTTPLPLSPLRSRTTSDPFDVRATDDVVICHSDRPGAAAARLGRALGGAVPPILAVATEFEEQDVVAGFDAGVISYIRCSDEVDPATMGSYVAGAAFYTSRGESCLSPAAATTLLRHTYRDRLQPDSKDQPERTSRPGQKLTPRERQIMELLVTGHTVAEISESLKLTGKTVRNNLTNIYAKLQVRRQSEAILLWLGEQPRPAKPLPARAVPGRRARHAPAWLARPA